MTPTAPRDAPEESAAGFRRFICWNPARVGRIMNTEALETASDVFLATHSPMPLFRWDLSGGSARRVYDEQQFLRDFLAPHDYALVAVLGGAGTGKSHLIRWLAMRVPSTSARRVVLIPRAGTSLYEVLRRVLDGIKGELFEQYRRRLAEASSGMTLPEARIRLLQNLALAVEGVGRSTNGHLTEQEQGISEDLPKLLGDVVFRDYFVKEDGVLDRLARQVIGMSGVERVGERRGFVEADLPLDFRAVNQAAKPAQDFYRALLGSDELRTDVVRWLNAYLDQAVAQLMSLSGADLLQLMRDVRIALAEQGVELVFLIEDLATLQGIDKQLLEALIVRPRQEGMEPLCPLRTAVAMTSGYYEGLPKPIQQRFDFRVTMDEGVSDLRGNVEPRDVRHFAARYLNATRLSREALTEWSEQLLPEQPLTPAPSACAPCPYREQCHAAFGAVEGIGFYPLSEIAVDHIARRVSPDGFNPRALLKEGLKPLLENYADSLRGGTFPPLDLLNRFGKTRLSSIVIDDLRRDDPVNHDRRMVLLDLWSKNKEVHNLAPVIHEAFALPIVPKYAPSEQKVRTEVRDHDSEVVRSGEESDPGAAHEIPPNQVVAPTSKMAHWLIELDQWNAGGALSQRLTQELREAVFRTIVAYVDWDAHHLLSGYYVGNAKAFKQSSSVNFQRQFLQVGQAPVRLTIPLRPEDPADCTDATLALQGLLLFKEHESWAFENGGRYYRAYLRQVESWSRHVLAELQDVSETQSGWDPVPATVELLAIGARLFGRPRQKDPETLDILNAILTPLPNEDSERSDSWQALGKSLQKPHDKLREMLLARVACSKGSYSVVQVVDAARMLPALRRVKRVWGVQESIPAKVKKSYDFLTMYQQLLEKSLTAAIEEERTRQLEQHGEMFGLLGLTGLESIEELVATRQGTVSAVREAIAAAAAANVLRGYRATAEDALAKFESMQFRAWAENLSRLADETDSGAILGRLSASTGTSAKAILNGLSSIAEMLARTVEVVEGEVRLLEEQGGSDVEDAQHEIDLGLTTIVDHLTKFSTQPGDA